MPVTVPADGTCDPVSTTADGRRDVIRQGLRFPARQPIRLARATVAWRFSDRRRAALEGSGRSRVPRSPSFRSCASPNVRPGSVSPADLHTLGLTLSCPVHAQRPLTRQHLVLRMLYLHRYLAVDQIATLVFATASRRACQACCTTLHRKGFVHRFELARGGLGGGRSSYVYALAPAGAQVLAQADNIPVVDIPVDPDAPTAQSVFVHHQLAANRCLVAVTCATWQSPRTQLCQWISDPHSRLRYRPDGARSWRSVHPDVIAMLRDADRDNWAFLEIDRGGRRAWSSWRPM